jgi:hypothetical protein
MISAADLRRAQEANQATRQDEAARRKDEAEAREAKIVDRFRIACDKYVDVLLNEAKRALEYVQKTNKTYIILDHREITKDVEGFSYTTLIYGFWSRAASKFEDRIFTKNDIQRPFDRAAAELEKFGYKLENVSDPTRSHRLFIKLTW